MIWSEVFSRQWWRRDYPSFTAATVGLWQDNGALPASKCFSLHQCHGAKTKGQQDPGYVLPPFPQLRQQLAPGLILDVQEKAEENTQAKSWSNYTEFKSKYWQSSLFQTLLTYHNPHYTKYWWDNELQSLEKKTKSIFNQTHMTC